ncbi:MAG: class I SAM-dependent methyltransferase [bacterium]
MEKKEYEKMFQLEETHWWFSSKRALVLELLKRYSQGRTIMKILDVGCGAGITLHELQRHGDAYGIDLSPEAIFFSRKRNMKNLVQASVTHLPFADKSFDAVTCLDLIYHRNVEDDEAALSEIARVCRTGAILILTDSALQILWSRHDQTMHAARRYTTRQIRQKIENAGFSILRLSYTNSILLPVSFLLRKIDLLHTGAPLASVNPVHPVLNRLLLLVSCLETFALRYFNFPIGSSILCIAEKEESVQKDTLKNPHTT